MGGLHRLFSKAELDFTPSREDGLSAADEKRLRGDGARFIHEIGKKLRMYVVLEGESFGRCH